jgi:hypothetical protein
MKNTEAAVPQEGESAPVGQYAERWPDLELRSEEEIRDHTALGEFLDRSFKERDDAQHLTLVARGILAL